MEAQLVGHGEGEARSPLDPCANPMDGKFKVSHLNGSEFTYTELTGTHFVSREFT